MANAGRRQLLWGSTLYALVICTAATFLLLHSASFDYKNNNDHAVGLIDVLPSHIHGQVANLDTKIVNDGSLVWITPKPNSPRRLGYEDDWLMQWKNRHYNIHEHPNCTSTYETPFDDDLLCYIPGYIPARLYDKEIDTKYSIPRVIFTTWANRRIGRSMYTSLLTLIHHNPELEFIFFNDEDVDMFMCRNDNDMTKHNSRDEFAIPIFSRIQSGAMRSDIWRLFIIQHYGGIYVDSDVSSLAKFPIDVNNTAVSGVACWSHLPSQTGGALEHWAIAFMPHHPYITEAVSVMTRNLQHPEYLLRNDTKEAEAEDSWTMRLTGPAMYQHTLHQLLQKSKCKKVDNSYCPALYNPEKHCNDMDTFRTFIPNGQKFMKGVNFANTFSHKLFYPSNAWEKETTEFFPFDAYDDPHNAMLSEADDTFCDASGFEKRAEERKRLWEDNVAKNS